MTKDFEQAWTEKYWDIVGELYWVPAYLGLKSIPRSKWSIDGDRVTIPKALTNSSGPLYRRVRSGQDYWDFVKRQEETFNHIFDLALATIPGDVTADIFSPFVSADDCTDLKLQGRSLRQRYPWIGGGNVTTPDSFLISDEAILAIEIKFNAKTSLDQLAKYVALIAGEELVGGMRRDVDLLYIFPSDPSRNFEEQTSLKPGLVPASMLPEILGAVGNDTVRQFMANQTVAVRDTLKRLQISCVSWGDVTERLDAYAARLGTSAGDRTLTSLLRGLSDEIRRHPLSRKHE